MLETLDDFYDKNNVFDIEIVSNLGLTDNDIKALSNINNIDKIIGIYSKDEYLNTINEQYVIRLIGLSNNINNVYLEEGRLPKNNNEIVVEKALLKDNNIKINDNIIINNMNYKIVGTVLSPLYFSTEKPATTLGSGKIDYYAYTLDGNIKNDVYTNIYITVSNAKDELTNNNKYKSLIENVKNDIDKIKESREKIRYNELYDDIIQNSNKYGIEIDKSKLIEPKWYILNRLDNESYKELINASENIKKLGNVFPLIFFAISILISLISMMRMIEEDRTENGTLKSLGYNNFEITLKYIIYSLLATTIGGTLGVFIGSYLIPYVIWDTYKNLFFIPTFIYAINSFSNALGLWICILCICGTAIFVCIHELKDVPANLMRPKNPKSGKKITLEKISIIWKKLKFSDKITIRNIFRYKTRVFTTIFGIAGCTALILAGFGLKDSIKNITNYQFNTIFKFDKILMINENANYDIIKSNLLNNNNISKMVEVNMQNIKVSNNNERQDTTLIVPDNLKQLDSVISLINIDNQEKITNIEKNTCVISEKTAKLLNLKVQDSITILDNENNEKKLKISYITKNYINQYIYITKDTYNNLFKNYSINSILVDLNKTNIKDSSNFDKEYINNNYVTTIVNNKDIENYMNDMLSSINSIVAILIIAATALAFVVLYNLSNINISERKREIATLKVLGFYPKEVDKYINNETIILTTIGICLGLIFGSYLSHFIISTCEPDYITFDRQVYALSYIYSALITIMFTFIVNIVTHFNLKKINMITSLKNVE